MILSTNLLWMASKMVADCADMGNLVANVAIYTHFETMEQKLIFEAVVLPDIRDVLNKYAPVLGCLGVSEDIERFESEDKNND